VLGVLNPIVAAVAMAGSSLAVVANSLRARRVPAARAMRPARAPLAGFADADATAAVEDAGAS
jgi:hypothetical protein